MHDRLLFITLFLAMTSMDSCHSKVFNVSGIYRDFTFPLKLRLPKFSYGEQEEQLERQQLPLEEMVVLM